MRRAALAVALVAAAVVIVALVGLGLRDRARRPASLLLVSIDTLRADHLGSYGYAAAARPILDGLAASGLRFAQATTVAPLTLPAHSSLLTGTFPALHGVRDNGGFYVGDERDDARRGAAGAGIPHRRVRRGVRARLALGNCAGLRALLRRFRPVPLRRPPGSTPCSARGRGRREGHRVAGRRQEAALLRLGASLRPPHALRPARALPLAVSRDAGGCLRRRDRLERRAGRTAARGPPGRRPAREHPRRRRRRSRRVAGRAPRADTRLLRLRRDRAHPPDHGRPRRARARRRGAGPDRRRDADRPGPARRADPARPFRARACCPWRAASACDLLAVSESWYPRYHYGWSELTAVRDGRYKFIDAPRRELYDLSPRSRASSPTLRGEPGAIGRRSRARSRGPWPSSRARARRQGPTVDRSRGGRAAAGARIRRRRTEAGATWTSGRAATRRTRSASTTC